MNIHSYMIKIYFCNLLIITGISACFIDSKNLTLDQKIGQLFMVAAVADEEIAYDVMHKKPYRMDKEYIEYLIEQYHIGGIIFLGKSDHDKQKNRTQHFQQLSTIPLLIGQDLEPGRVGAARFADFAQFPSNEKIGELNNPEYTYETAKKIGEIAQQLGVHMVFAPVADVNNNPDNPVINDRSFGDCPELVAKHAIIFAQGLHDAGIFACAKHFPGHGDTSVDSHYDLPCIAHDKTRLHAVELIPFKKLIAENIPAIMIAHLAIPAFENNNDIPASLSKNIVTKLLCEELKFNGLIITDALDMRGVTKNDSQGKTELQALLAGNDILLSPIDVSAGFAAIKQALADGIITEEEIDRHVEKIVRLKNEINIQNHP